MHDEKPEEVYGQLAFLYFCIDEFPVWKKGCVALAAANGPFNEFTNWRRGTKLLDENKWFVCTHRQWHKARIDRGLAAPVSESVPDTRPRDLKTPWNPSVKAVNRVRDPLPLPKRCPHCESHVEILRHENVYDGRRYGDWPWLVACSSDDCDARVGLHPFTAIPLGTLATTAIREARIRCKKTFQQLYEDGYMTRPDAYGRLAEKLGIDRCDCHFGLFDTEQCYAAQAASIEIKNEVIECRTRI